MLLHLLSIMISYTVILSFNKMICQINSLSNEIGKINQFIVDAQNCKSSNTKIEAFMLRALNKIICPQKIWIGSIKRGVELNKDANHLLCNRKAIINPVPFGNQWRGEWNWAPSITDLIVHQIVKNVKTSKVVNDWFQIKFDFISGSSFFTLNALMKCKIDW